MYFNFRTMILNPSNIHRTTYLHLRIAENLRRAAHRFCPDELNVSTVIGISLDAQEIFKVSNFTVSENPKFQLSASHHFGLLNMSEH